MKNAYRIFRRKKGVFYLQENGSVIQKSLGTKDPYQAEELLRAENEAPGNPRFNLQMGKTHLTHSDPTLGKRTMQDVIEELSARGIPERFSQAALGHSSKAVHRAYAKNAHVVCPPLEDANNKVIPLMQPKHESPQTEAEKKEAIEG